MQRFRLRAAAPASTESAPRIDRDAGVIRGVAVMTTGEARGHNMVVDAVTLSATADLINAKPEGVKSRFTHPGMCDDGMGKKLGTVKNARVVGDQVVADLHFSGSASKTPSGDLAGYVLERAEESAGDFGLSVVVTGKTAWRVPGGVEVMTRERPVNADSDKPYLRPTSLAAVDVVDEPAANPSGLLAAAFSGTTNVDADEAFSALDAMREARGLSLDQAHSFVARYFDARGLTHKIESTPMTISPDRLAELCEKHSAQAGAITKAFAAGKTEAEILAVIADADRAALAAKVEDLTAKLAAMDAAHVAALKAETDKLAALQAKHDQLAALGANAPADPGTLPAGAGTGDPIVARWSAMSAAEQGAFFNDIEVFREAEKLRAKDLAASK